MYCIYRITNKINGHIYIGQHKYEDESNPMGKYKGSGKILWLAYNKYGFENFETEILYKRIRDKETVDAMEIWAIEKYKPEYNITKGGSGGDTFTNLSVEEKEIRRKKWSVSSKAQLAKLFADPERKVEYLAKRNATMQKMKEDGYVCPTKGRPHTEEHNAKVKEANKRFYEEHEHNALYGTTFDKDHCEKISNSRKGYKWFNNGQVSVQAKECPEGFVPGLCEADKEKRRGHTPWNKGKKGVQVAWNKGLRGQHTKKLEGDK